MAGLKNLSILVVVAVLILLFSSMFVVSEGEHALVLRLGEIKTDSKTGEANVYQPGLHFKAPFINTARDFDVRLRTMAVQASRILTNQQKYVLVDYYAKWRIDNLPLYYKTTGGLSVRTESLLAQKINNALRAEIGNLSLSEVISGSRHDIMDKMKEQANIAGDKMGIDVLDVRIKRIDLPLEVSKSVFERMRTERQRVATKHRSNGKAESNAIRAKADAAVTIGIAEAQKDAANIRAKGNAQAASIYAKAYKQDPEFYAFYRSLEAYQQTFNSKSDLLLIQPDGDFFKYFNEIKKKAKPKG